VGLWLARDDFGEDLACELLREQLCEFGDCRIQRQGRRSAARAAV
jgi:hypothetical protein